MFDEKDLQQIREHGLTPEQAETQLENFRRGFPFLNVVRAASPGDGVLVVGAAEADAAVAGAAVVCWGSLAQRNAVSRRTILALVDAAPVGCLRLFDINLRLNYYDERIDRDSLERADILKLNEDELPVVARFFGLEGAAERVVAQLVERFSLRYVVFTEGGRGSRVTAADGRTSYLATPRVEVADTVGAGDAFTATFAASLMQGLPMEECHRRAVAVAAFVCTRHGAIAPLSEFMKTEITNR